MRHFPAYFAIALLLYGCGSGDEYSPYGGTNDPVGVKIGKPYSIKGTRYYPKADPYYDETGLASWYGPGFDGRMTASGEKFDQDEMTAAHKTLPMPSMVKVTHERTGKEIIVRINDRGPFAPGRIIDLSKRAAQELGSIGEGVAPVRVEYLPDETERFYAAHNLTLPEALRNHSRSYAKKTPVLEPAPMPNPTMPTTRFESEPAFRFEPASPVISVSGAFDTISAEELPPLTSNVTVPNAYNEDAFAVLDPMPTRKNLTLGTGDIRNYYVQVASFRGKDNAHRLAHKLAAHGSTDIRFDTMNSLYRVRLGPVAEPAVADNMLMKAVAMGYRDAHVVNR